MVVYGRAIPCDVMQPNGNIRQSVWFGSLERMWLKSFVVERRREENVNFDRGNFKVPSSTQQQKNWSVGWLSRATNKKMEAVLELDPYDCC